jgi:hypothetical protein
LSKRTPELAAFDWIERQIIVAAGELEHRRHLTIAALSKPSRPRRRGESWSAGVRKRDKSRDLAACLLDRPSPATNGRA